MVKQTGWALLSVMVGLVVGGIATGLVDPLPSLQAQTTSPLTIQPETGRVGIGTMSPQFKLDVAGEIRATGGTAIYQLTAAGCGSSPLLTTTATCLTTGYQVCEEIYGHLICNTRYRNCAGGGVGLSSPATCNNALVGRLVAP